MAIFTLFVVSGVRGVDFGVHWDEAEWQIKPVREMVSTGLLMPRATVYPAFSKWLTFAQTFPVAVKVAVKAKGDPRAIQNAMLAKVNDPGFLLRTRRLYVVFSALAIILVWAAVLAMRRPWWEAVAAAACVGLSWEYSYHSRWVATDCLVVVFSALTLLLLGVYFRNGRLGWLYAAALAAGFGTGAKYPGLVLLVPVVLAGALTLPFRPLRGQFKRMVALCALGFVAYLVTTPATVFEPFTFVEMYRWIAQYYAQGHWGYSVTGPVMHVRLVLTYFAVAFFSPYPAIAVILFACAVAGGVFLVRSDRRLGAVLVTFPIAFLLLFCGRYRAMIARNYLLVVPFLAALAARGLSEIGARLPRRELRWGLAGLAVAAFVVGGVWMTAAGESIRHPDSNKDVQRALKYVSKHPGTRFSLSPKVKSIAQAQKLAIPANAQTDAGAEQAVFFLRAEGGDPFRRSSNDVRLIKAVFGPRDVNLNWYTTWAASDHVVFMRLDKAKWAGLSIAK